MKTYIALLKGINVGGHKKIPMAELRSVLTNIGLDKVQTYIQSGNVIFQSSINNLELLEKDIQNSILDHFSFEVPVIVKTMDDLSRILKKCPFSEDKKVLSYFVLLNKIPKPSLINEVSEKTYPNDEFVILNDCIYLYCEKGYGKSKFNLNYFEQKLNVNATARNYKTMIKLLSLSADK